MKHLLLKLSFLEIVFPLDVKCQPGQALVAVLGRTRAQAAD